MKIAREKGKIQIVEDETSEAPIKDESVPKDVIEAKDVAASEKKKKKAAAAAKKKVTKGPLEKSKSEEKEIES